MTLRLVIFSSLLVLSVASVLRQDAPRLARSIEEDGEVVRESPRGKDTGVMESTLPPSDLLDGTTGKVEAVVKEPESGDGDSTRAKVVADNAKAPKRSLTMLTMMLLNPGSNTTTVATGSSGSNSTTGQLVGTLRTLLSYVLSLLGGLTGSL